MQTKIDILGPEGLYTAHLNTEAYDRGTIYRAWRAHVAEARAAAERAKAVELKTGPYTVSIEACPHWRVRTGDIKWSLDDITRQGDEDSMTLEAAEAVLAALEAWAS